MATVRITDDIRRYVTQKINALFEDRIKAKEGELQHLDIALQVFMSNISKEEFEVAKKLNTDIKWVPEIGSLSVTVEYEFEGMKRKFYFSVPFKPPVPAPSRFHGYGQPPWAVKPTLPCYPHAVQVLLAVEQLNKERDTLVAALSKVLTQCSTLRQVLEVWPTALDYMPESVKKRHAEKSEKRGPTVIEGVDDHAKMLLMKARMINGV